MACLQLHLYDEAGTRRLYCTDLHAVDPAVVMVQQGAGYPDGYFNDVPAAKVLKHGYPITMRPGSTDVAVMNQVQCVVLAAGFSLSSSIPWFFCFFSFGQGHLL